MKDLVIIGGGPAGLTAAIYGLRAGMDLVMLERLAPGGQVMKTFEVENYPGFVDPVEGWDLMQRMEQQARRLGLEVQSTEVASLEKNETEKCFTLFGTDGSTMQARTVIAATGASFRNLNVPGESEFLGRGVSYCATCDGAFYKDRVTAVVGGGDTALEEAMFLTRFSSKVYLIHRRDEFRAARILQERVLSNKAIEPVYCNTVQSINGSMKVDSVSIRNKDTGEESTLTVDGVFIFVGYDPITGYLPAQVLNEKEEVIVDMQMRTSIPGLFAAGDLREQSKKQIVMAAADGATAAIEAYEYCENL